MYGSFFEIVIRFITPQMVVRLSSAINMLKYCYNTNITNINTRAIILHSRGAVLTIFEYFILFFLISLKSFKILLYDRYKNAIQNYYQCLEGVNINMINDPTPPE